MENVLKKQSRGDLKSEYRTYLCQHRGLTDKTIRQYCSFVDRFLDFKFGDSSEDLTKITSIDVTNFLLYTTGRVQPYRDKSLASNLRSFFRFLFQSEKIETNLSIGIPSVSYRSLRRIPYHLTTEQVEELLNAVKTAPNSKCKKRNYSMVLLMARLGLRSTEVIAIQLDDIDWRNGLILIRGKGGYHDKVPLLKEIGESISDYICYERKGTSRYLFLGNNASHDAFKDAQILNTVLKQSLEYTNIQRPKQYTVSHMLRHSLASNLVRQGASLEEVSNTLRHRSRSTTLRYARLDITGLKTIAQSWPLKEGGRI